MAGSRRPDRRARGWWWLLCALLACSWAWPAQADTRVIDQAWIAPGAHRQDADVAWQTLSLPDAWTRSHRDGVWTVRLDLGPWPDGGRDMALWLPRAGQRLEVWVNGALAASHGQVDGGQQDYSLRPLLIGISPALLHPARNEVRVVLAADPSRRLAGLSRVWWGPMDELRPHHEARDRLIMGGAISVAVLSSIFGLCGLIVALNTRSQTAWLFAASGLVWAAREGLRVMVEPWPDRDLWITAYAAAFGITAICTSLTLLNLIQARVRWLRAGLWLALLLCPVAALVHARHIAPPHWLTWWMYSTMLCSSLTTLTGLVTACRQPTVSHITLALGSLSMIALSALDNWRYFVSPSPLGYESVGLASYMAVSFLLSVSAAVYVRIRRALKAEAHHKDELERQVQAQRIELQTLHERERERIETQAVSDERARIMRDMHDGLGSQLVGLLSTVQSGHLDQAELTQEVRDAIDQLRMTIDTLEPMDNDLASLLGQLRFRLEPRLRKVGIEVDWAMDELPGGDALGTTGLAHLRRLLYEVFSNVIKHARATRVTVRGRHDPQQGWNEIEIADNGEGFEHLREHAGRGLINMQTRADQMKASLSIQSQPAQGTRVRLRLPIKA